MERKYSVSEIDDMRRNVDRLLLRWNESYNAAERERTIELRLRTYMEAGIDPEGAGARRKGALSEGM